MNSITNEQNENPILWTGFSGERQIYWNGPLESIETTPAGIKRLLMEYDQPIFVVSLHGRVGFTTAGQPVPGTSGDSSLELLTSLPPLPPGNLGNRGFWKDYGTDAAYYAGAMANEISSVKMTVALGEGGLLGSYGAAGLSPDRLESAIQEIQAELPDGRFASNLIHNPNEPSLERKAVDLYLQYQVRHVEASAFLDINPNVVLYRAAGLERDGSGNIQKNNRIIAKLSRKEVATKFMQPAPADMLDWLVSEGSLLQEQAELARLVPLADDITAEADSGGHTDNRPLVCLLPVMIVLRDEIQAKQKYLQPIRVGAGGGISTPHSALAAFMLGADYIVTGSVNQSCVEAGSSAHTKNLLAQADMADVIMAPSADMFEMGVKVQLLKRGTMFPMRAHKLYETYQRYNSLEEIPPAEAEKLKKQIFQRDFEDIWQDTIQFFMKRDPSQIEKANANPKRKMALVFRWYLGLSSRWSNAGVKGREMDYQIWCGPAMGAFNDWVRGTYMEKTENRKVVDVARHILHGAAYLSRIRSLALQGCEFPAEMGNYRPEGPLI